MYENIRSFYKTAIIVANYSEYKCGGCIVGNSKIQLLDGTTETIQELVEKQNVDKIPCIDMETCKLVEGKITQFCDTGIQDTIKITLANGQEICGTYDHPVIKRDKEKKTVKYNNEIRKFRMWDWHRLDEIEIGDTIGIPKEIPHFGKYQEPYARFFGLMIGDGNYSYHIRIGNADKEILDYIKSLNFNYKTCKEKSYFTKDGRFFEQIEFSNLRNMFRKVGIYGQSKEKKRLPIHYENYTEESLKELIAGIFDTDGSFILNKENILYKITLYSISKELLKQVQNCLLKIGIQSSIYLVRKEKQVNILGKIRHANSMYELQISKRNSIVQFAKEIKLLVPLKQKNLNTAFNSDTREKISENLLNTDLRFEKVVKIEYTGKQHVYDLTVDEYHNFIANNIFVHNTNAKIVQIGTPKTRNHFYDAVEGKAHEKWTVVKRDWTRCEQLWSLDAIYLPDPKTGIVRPYSRFVLEQAMPKVLKEEMFPNNPELWTEGNLSIEDFKTQYMLEFIDGAGKYLDSDQIKKMTDGQFDWLDHGIIGENYVAGIDFAGSNPDGDSTQITVLRVARDGTKQKVFSKEFQDTSYPQQMYYISNLFGGYHPRFECKKIFADYTGCGAAVVQTLQEEFGIKNLEGIIFNARDRFTGSGMNMKNIMYAKWRQELDNGKFKYMTKERFLKSTAEGAGENNIGYYHRMVSEWADLEQTVTGYSVNKKIEAPLGYHDDVPDSDVLANFAAVEGRRGHMPKATAGRYKFR